MKRADISRRQFAKVAGTAAAVGLPIHGATTLTAQAVVERLQSALGGEWPTAGIDGFKAGDPSVAVKGIATTAMATQDVLKQAARTGSNLVMTYEPTFYGRQDGPSSSPPPAAGGRGGGRGFGGVSAEDPVYKGKKEFIEKNGLVVFRLHDHWQIRKEGEMATGLAEALGWGRNRIKPDDVLYEIPPAAAEDVVGQIRKKLSLRGGLRAVGDRKATVRKVMLCPGVMTPSTIWQRYAEVDLIIAGEVREWENTYFAADLFSAGEKHGLVTIGRVVSEDPGMRACAAWLSTVVKEVPAQWIGAGDLYWRPA
jgi:putative NIF3 family GTP cyclohydrolase 1 type 2